MRISPPVRVPGRGVGERAQSSSVVAANEIGTWPLGSGARISNRELNPPKYEHLMKMRAGLRRRSAALKEGN